MTARLPFLSSFASLKSNYYEQNYIFFGQSVFGQLAYFSRKVYQ
jgi:hypothetical protein